MWKKADWKFGESKVKVAMCGFIEDLLGERGRGFGSGGANGPEDNVELRGRDGSEKVRGFS